MKLSLSILENAQGAYRRRIRRANGTRTPWSRWERNLILDIGMNQLFTGGSNSPWSAMASHAQVGTGNLAVERQTNGTGITLSQATNQVTASGSFFLSTDVGAILKYGSSGTAGAEQYITGYTSAFVVTVSSSATVAPTDGTVWQVQQVALQTFAAGDNGTYEADVVTFSAAGTPKISFKRGFQFPAAGGSVTYRELGFGWQNSGNLWSRVLVPGSGDALTVGQIYEVEYLLTVFFPAGAAQAAIGDLSGGAWNTAGTYMLETLYGMKQTIGGGGSCAWLDPGGTAGAYVSLATANWTQQTVVQQGDLGDHYSFLAQCDSVATGSYAAGSFTITHTAHWNILTAVATITGICAINANGQQHFSGWTVKFTTPIAKDNSHTVDLTSTVTAARILAN